MKIETTVTLRDGQEMKILASLPMGPDGMRAYAAGVQRLLEGLASVNWLEDGSDNEHAREVHSRGRALTETKEDSK